LRDGALLYLRRSQAALDAAVADPRFAASIAAIAERLAAALAAGGKVLLAGNGGSAGDAQHIAGELVGRLNYDRAPLCALALTTDSSVVTALANDYGYDEVFARQVRGLGRPGDAFVAISTSGRSRNILGALMAARAHGLVTIGLGGRDGGAMPPLCDLCLLAPAHTTSLVQQLHITAAHAICGLVEARLFPR
jgi:D-sedoheptulose 7-phosphate isomerase